MLAVVRAVHRRKPFQTVVAVPIASVSTVKLLGPRWTPLSAPISGAATAFPWLMRTKNGMTSLHIKVTNLLKSHGQLANKSVYLAPIFPDLSHKFISNKF